MLLKEKKILVTGSSRGIGKEIVKRFLEEGATVWGMCTKPSAAKEELEKCAQENKTAFYEFYADASNIEQLKDAVLQVQTQAESFDVLVNNAGITKDGLSFRMKLEDWNSVLQVNLTAVFVISQIISNDMIKKRRGSIINISSIVGLRGQAGQVNYAASKAGLIGYTKSLAKETGGRGVRVNAIAPGYIETDMTDKIPEEARKAWLENIPLKRAGTVRDVADAAVFLASDMSLYINASVLSVDGGLGA